MKHLGDITKINGAEIEPVDVICFGSPCQDLSVAGLRNGLSGERSGLFMDAVRIIKEMRDADRKRLQVSGSDVDIRLLRPRFAIWENVPGAFSSNNGEDFRVVLEELAHVIDKDVAIPKPKEKWKPSGLINGEQWTLNIGEFPNEERESHLSWIVQENVPEKYSLSPKACQGILNRASKRGKALPSVLQEALESVVLKATPLKSGGVRSRFEGEGSRQGSVDTTRTVSNFGSEPRPNTFLTDRNRH